MNINSHNEWDQLREVVVGCADKANWPAQDPVFAALTQKSHRDLAGAVPQHMIDQANQDLDQLCEVLRSYQVTVHRAVGSDWQQSGAMNSYAIRDRVLIAGDTLLDTATMIPCRESELGALGNLTKQTKILKMPRGKELVMDGTNVCRLGRDWLYLESRSGSRAAGEWLSNQFPQVDIHGCMATNELHINSVLVPLREGLILVNGQAIKPNQLPKVLEKWDKIWVDNVVEVPQSSALSSPWIGISCLSINHQTAVVDADQIDLIDRIEQHGITVIPQRLRHARALGGGLHSVVLDTWRENR